MLRGIFMQVSVENTSAIARRMTIELPGALVQSELGKRLKNAVSHAKMNGFRPGKVSKATEKRYQSSILQDIMWEKFEQALKDQNIAPAGQPVAFEPSEFVQGKDFSFVVDFDVMPPEIEVVDHSDIEIIRPEHELTEADIEEMITALRKQASTFKEVDKTAQEGDRVIIDFVGKLDGESFEGGTAKEQALELGSKQMIPGFEDALIGVKKDEERTFKVTFPADYHAENLAGKEVEFTVKVTKVEEIELAPIDNELFKRYGMADGDEPKFVAEVRKNMERELRQAIKSKIKNQVFAALLKKYDCDLPRVWINSEASSLRDQSINQMNSQYGMKLNPQDFPFDRFKEKAKNRILLGLIVRKIIDKNELKVDEQRVNAMIEEIASVYEEPQEVIKQLNEDKKGLEGIRSVVLEDQVVDLLLSQIKVTNEAMTYQDAVKPNEKMHLDI